MRAITSSAFAILASLLVSLAIVLAAGPASAQLLPGVGGGSEAGAEEPAEGEATDPVALLLQVLRDDAAREELVRQLEDAVAAGEGSAEAEAAAEEVRPGLSRRIADITRGVAENTALAVGNFWETLARAPAALSGFGAEELGVLLDAFRNLLLVIVSTVAAFVVLRSFAIPIYRRIGERSAHRTVVGRIVPFLAAGVMDLAIVLAAWAIGYAAALLVFGELGRIELQQTLYLNAFLVVETIKAVLRLILSPSTEHLRPLAVSDWAAKRLYRTARIVVSLVGYGLLLVTPLVSDNAGFLAGRSAMVLIWLLAILYLAVMVLWYRRPVATWLLSGAGSLTSTTPAGEQSEAELDAEIEGETAASADQVEDPTADPATRRRRIFLPLAQTWHWLALAWLLWLLVTVLGRSPDAVIDVLAASGQVALVFLAGFVVSGLLGRVVERGITLPRGLTKRVPLLEARLNRYVPKIMLAARLLIFALVVIFAFDTLNVFSTRGFLDSQLGLRVTGVIFSVGAILLVAFVVWLAMTSWVDYRLNPSHGSVPTAREETLLTLLKNGATIAILVLTLMFALSEIGLNIGPLLASAGVVGLAIGFGAQKMVQDIITGIFIQFENAINVGDVVSAGGTTGVVERLTVRSVSLRDLDGVYHIIPFSSVDTVSNFMRDFSFWLADMGVAYRESVDDVKQAMFDAFEELRVHPEQGGFIIGDLEWFGLNSFGDSAIVVRARIKTWPGKQWGVGRAYNEIIKRIFDERGIEIPFPHTTVWFGEDRQGKAPPLRVAGRMETLTETVRRRRDETGEEAGAATGAGVPPVATPTQDAPPEDPN